MTIFKEAFGFEGRSDNGHLQRLKEINYLGCEYTNENYVKDEAGIALENEEKGKHLWSVVSKIPQKYRELILLRYVENLKYEDIAKITNIPVGTVKNRIFKAKEILRKEIEYNELFV